jgi:hypothetical protein
MAPVLLRVQHRAVLRGLEKAVGLGTIQRSAMRRGRQLRRPEHFRDLDAASGVRSPPAQMGRPIPSPFRRILRMNLIADAVEHMVTGKRIGQNLVHESLLMGQHDAGRV